MTPAYGAGKRDAGAARHEPTEVVEPGRRRRRATDRTGRRSVCRKRHACQPGTVVCDAARAASPVPETILGALSPHPQPLDLARSSRIGPPRPRRRVLTRLRHKTLTQRPPKCWCGRTGNPAAATPVRAATRTTIADTATALPSRNMCDFPGRSYTPPLGPGHGSCQSRIVRRAPQYGRSRSISPRSSGM